MSALDLVIFQWHQIYFDVLKHWLFIVNFINIQVNLDPPYKLQ